jgi:hypothetical protein
MTLSRRGSTNDDRPCSVLERSRLILAESAFDVSTDDVIEMEMIYSDFICGLSAPRPAEKRRAADSHLALADRSLSNAYLLKACPMLKRS